MSVHFLSGKPGGGKTLYALMLILAELRRGKLARHVVTNVVLNLGAINELLNKEGIELPLHINEMVTFIEEEDLKEFYRHRGYNVFLPLKLPTWQALTELEKKRYAAEEEKVRKSRIADFAGVPLDENGRKRGVFYVLDEIHIAFNSRQWADSGEGVMYYLSQHRKLGDTAILITQSVQNVDRQMRSVAQDFTYLRNLKKERAGLFKLPAVFMRRQFLEPAGPTSKACNSGVFKLDLKVANCYDTGAGVGIMGDGADKEEKTKGLPWWVAILGIVLIIWAALHYVPKFVQWMFDPKLAVAKAAATFSGKDQSGLTNAVPKSSPVVSNQDATFSRRQNDLRVPNQVHKTNEITVTGYAGRADGSWWVFYSDGAEDICQRHELGYDGRFVWVRGQPYRKGNGKRENLGQSAY